MVVSPSSTALAAQQELASIASECSRRLGLRGLMDVESILTPQGNRVLELDARIPSQTPSAVLHSHGVNILREMVRLAMDGNVHLPNASSQRCAVFGHVIQDSGFLRTTGEGGLRADRPMHLREGTFGADQLLTDATDWREEFACTYIISAPSASEVRFKLQRFFAQMEDASGLRLRDPGLVRP
jgi:pyrrolysine biosynthesis protein PylC